MRNRRRLNAPKAFGDMSFHKLHRLWSRRKRTMCIKNLSFCVNSQPNVLGLSSTNPLHSFLEAMHRLRTTFIRKPSSASNTCSSPLITACHTLAIKSIHSPYSLRDDQTRKKTICVFAWILRRRCQEWVRLGGVRPTLEDRIS
jgi:hypothetical protein